MEKKRVFILDDHPLLRRGLAQLINLQPDLEVWGESSNSNEALEILGTVNPHLVIVDISVEGPNGIEFIKKAKEKYPNIIFFVHSMHDEALYAERALRAGARGYLMKQETPEQMILAIRRILSGQIYLSENMRERMLEQRYKRIPDVFAPLEVLSDRELEVFQFIGKGETTAKIAERLHRSSKTIEACRSRIKEKLNLRDNMQLIRHAVQWHHENRSPAEEEIVSF